MEADQKTTAGVVRAVGRGAACLDHARRRNELLRLADAPGLLAAREVSLSPEGDVFASFDRIEGDDLATVLRLRGALKVGECVEVGVAVAEALAAMHALGLAHGDVSPANIMIAGAGSPSRAVLVDTLAGESAAEAGTPGFASPERPAGATAAGDVFSLGRVLLEAVREADRERLAPWVDPMLVADPTVRPTAAMVARALPACAPPERVEVPASGVVTALRSRALGPKDRTLKRADARWWRAKKRAVRWGSIGATAAICLWGVSVIANHAWDASHPAPQVTFDPAMPTPAWAAVSPHEAGRVVTLARFDALADGDAQALLATTFEGSDARRAVAAQADALADGSLTVTGLHATVESVEVLSATGDRATVVVAYTLSAHAITTEGERTDYAPDRQTIEMDLRWTGAGWQAERVREVGP